HQHVRVGAYAMIGGCSGVGQDVPPFMRAAGGYRARLYGLNSIGLKRHGFSNARIGVLKQAYEALFRSGYRMAEALKRAREQFRESADVLEVIAFLEGSRRGVCRSVGKDLESEE
ncbi:MAG: acyl-ACP--UDP-N-acetylglucosamine O-acyltransferase, partial [Candidatus Methylomirabilales bacterium]